MGMVYADIELINADDLAMVRRNIIGEDEVKSLHVNMLVDTGAYMLSINENIQEYLQLPFVRKQKFVTANGKVEEFDVVGPLEVRFKDRNSFCTALVLEGNAEPLLGAIPMEEMDVMVHPNRQELVGNIEHPERSILKLKGLRKIKNT